MPTTSHGLDASLVLLDVPDELAPDVGHIVARWARLEWELTRCLYALHNFTEQQGRKAFPAPRIKDVLHMISSFVTIRKLNIEEDLATLATDLKRAYERRNWLCHSIWMFTTSENVYRIRVVAGEWQPESLEKGKVSRREEPEHVIITKDWYEELQENIINITTRLEHLRRELART